jgi:hypothetical protein
MCERANSSSHITFDLPDWDMHLQNSNRLDCCLHRAARVEKRPFLSAARDGSTDCQHSGLAEKDQNANEGGGLTHMSEVPRSYQAK